MRQEKRVGNMFSPQKNDHLILGQVGKCAIIRGQGQEKAAAQRLSSTKDSTTKLTPTFRPNLEASLIALLKEVLRNHHEACCTEV